MKITKLNKIEKLLGAIIILALISSLIWFIARNIKEANQIFVENYTDNNSHIDSQVPLGIDTSNRLTISIDRIKTVPPGLAVGKAIPYVGKNKIEQNMISQINTYNQAVLRGDIANIEKYLYSDMIVYFKRFAPESSDKDIIAALCPSMKSELQKFEIKGIEIKAVVINLQRKIISGHNIIIVFNSALTMSNEIMQTYLTPVEVVMGISFNDGQKWSFLSMTDDTPNILGLRFDEDIINRVMNY